MDVLEMPVTLVVKAPNERIDYHVVNCVLGWTVKKLKKHLSVAYPNKPKENQQRLIYSGKLLKDEYILKDVLKHSYEETQTTHTVHLLCTATMSGERDFTNAGFTPSPSSSTSDTLRQRAVPSSNVSATGTPVVPTTPVSVPTTPNVSTPVSSYSPYSAYYTTANSASPINSNMMAAQYSAAQMMWYQQMYAQQMSQYMQLMQQTGQVMQGPIAVNTLGNNEQLPGQNEARPAGQPNQNNQQMVMNAAGGQVLAVTQTYMFCYDFDSHLQRA